MLRLHLGLTLGLSLAILPACDAEPEDDRRGYADDDDDRDDDDRDDDAKRDGDDFNAFGSGDYGIILSDDDPPIYCWYLEETTQICGGDLDTYYSDICLADQENCLRFQPDDYEEEDACYLRVDVRTVSGGPLYGTCDHLAAYWDDNDDSVECLFHKHCGEGGQCIDYECVGGIDPGAPGGSTEDPEPEPQPEPMPGGGSEDPDPEPDPGPTQDPEPEPEPEPVPGPAPAPAPGG